MGAARESHRLAPTRLSCGAAGKLIALAGGLSAAEAQAKSYGYTEADIATIKRRCPSIK